MATEPVTAVSLLAFSPSRFFCLLLPALTPPAVWVTPPWLTPPAVLRARRPARTLTLRGLSSSDSCSVSFGVSGRAEGWRCAGEALHRRAVTVTARALLFSGVPTCTLRCLCTQKESGCRRCYSCCCSRGGSGGACVPFLLHCCSSHAFLVAESASACSLCAFCLFFLLSGSLSSSPH